MFDEKKLDAFESLIGNWIGEVGQLHQKIQQLPTVMDASLSSTRNLLRDAQAALAKQLDSLPAQADQEMRRAGKQEISALSGEVAHLAKQIAGDAAAIERQKSFQITAGILTVFSIFFYGSGMWVGSQNLSMLSVSAICLAGGFIAGIAMCFMVIQPRQAQSKKEFEYLASRKEFEEKINNALK